MPNIPDKPTREQALAALQLLLDLLIEFPFIVDGGISLAVALSALITPVVRGAFSLTPIHCVTAADPGSGKSFLWDTAAAIAIGQAMPVTPWSEKDDAENEKRITAALACGQTLLSLDNVNGKLGGDALCIAITQTDQKIRPFRENMKTVDITTITTSVFANGNNISLMDDIVRRVIKASLDPRMERPELKVFENNPVKTIMKDRGKYIAACLTICRAYVVAGRPGKVAPLLSFEGWSDCVRSALMWLGQADPVASIEGTRAEDSNRIKRGNLLTAWANDIGIGLDHKCTMAKAVHTANETTQIKAFSGSPTHPELFDAMTAIARKYGSFDSAIDNEVLGKWLLNNKLKAENGLRFANVASKKGAQWYVEHLLGETEEQRYREQHEAEVKAEAAEAAEAAKAAEAALSRS
jgi:putative DNA primase/helicase